MSIEKPTILLPIILPNRPHTRIRVTAIALIFVGNSITAPLQMTDIEIPDNTRNSEKQVTVSRGCVSQSSSNPHVPELNKQKAEKIKNPKLRFFFVQYRWNKNIYIKCNFDA